MTIQSFADLLDRITPDMHANLRRAVELGRMPDGSRLTREQTEDLLRTLIAWEQKHLSERERAGFLPRKNCSSDEAPANGQPAKGVVGIFTPTKN